MAKGNAIGAEQETEERGSKGEENQGTGRGAEAQGRSACRDCGATGAEKKAQVIWGEREDEK